MNKEKIITIDVLKSAVDDCAREIEEEFPNLYFDYAGIIPNDDKTSRYDCTPLNTKVFARTGGDGVHYSIIEISEMIQPVVMTVPMNFGNSINDYNWILGENLNEFLSLGYYNGWFPLEQLCYMREQDWIIRFYSRENSDKEYLSDGDFQFIKKLRTKLNFEYKALNLDRLKKLEELYFGQLCFKVEFIERLNQWKK